MYEQALQTQFEYAMNVGGGIILGVYGRETNSDIVRVGFEMK